MIINLVTLFPEACRTYLQESILGRAQEQNILEIRYWNIRDYATGKHKTVDDTPYGGGAGMVMKVEPIERALEAASKELPTTATKKTIVLAARGQQFTQQKAQSFATVDALTLICGRYEGIDQRVADHLADEELSVGPYVLAGGELPALLVIETVARLLPGVLGNPDSLLEESFTAISAEANEVDHYQEYPQYTKPVDYKGWKVPPVLLSGNHQAIKDWREEQKK